MRDGTLPADVERACRLIALTRVCLRRDWHGGGLSHAENPRLNGGGSVWGGWWLLTKAPFALTYPDLFGPVNREEISINFTSLQLFQTVCNIKCCVGFYIPTYLRCLKKLSHIFQFYVLSIFLVNFNLVHCWQNVWLAIWFHHKQLWLIVLCFISIWWSGEKLTLILVL